MVHHVYPVLRVVNHVLILTSIAFIVPFGAGVPSPMIGNAMEIGNRFTGTTARQMLFAMIRPSFVSVGSRHARAVRQELHKQHRVRRVESHEVRETRRRMVASLRMQESGDGCGTLGRRQMVTRTAACAFAGCMIGRAPEAAADNVIAPSTWRPVYGRNGKPQWLGFNEAEKTFPLIFIEYLSRILLTYDATSMILFQSDTLPLSVLPKDERQQRLFEDFVRFSTSVEYGLRSYNGTEGADRLAKVLRTRFFDNPDALLQLGFLFTLMDTYQPVQEIERIMATWENASISHIVLQDGGAGYSGAAPRVLIKDDYGARVQASATCSLIDTGRILKVDVTSGGAGYTRPPQVTFPGLSAYILITGSIGSRLPQAEALLKDGKVVGVKIKDKGEGLVALGSGSADILSSLRVLFKPQDGDLPLSNAEGYAVLDRKVGAITLDNQGVGYTSIVPPKIEVEAPEECGGDASLGRRATAVARMAKGVRKSFYRETRMSVRRTSEDEEMASLIKLYPTSVCIRYSNSSQRFKFQETSLLGFNITTQYGPISQFARRSPYLKEVQLDTKVYWRLAAAGAICASIAHGLLVPLDTIKTRLQTSPKGSYGGFADACVRVFRDEGGLAALLRGLQPEVVGFSIYGALSFGGTEFCRRWIAELVGPEGALLFSIPILMLGSAVASAVAVSFACPFLVCKTRMIADDKFAGGSLPKALTRIVEEEEWQSALFGGLPPLLLKDVSFVLSKFVVFDIVKTAILAYFPEARDSLSSTLLVSLCSGTLAGMVSAVTSQPGDYLFSKSTSTADSSLRSAWTTYWNNGVNQGMWADLLTGLPARLVFSGTLIALQFVIYDYCRVQFHVSPNELMQFLDVMASVGPNAT